MIPPLLYLFKKASTKLLSKTLPPNLAWLKALFISKNLSWGIFKSTLINSSNTENLDFYDIYTQLLNQDQYDFIDPEIMLFMIIELVSSTCYSSILYNDPVKIEDLKPYLYDAVRNIIDRHIA